MKSFNSNLRESLNSNLRFNPLILGIIFEFVIEFEMFYEYQPWHSEKGSAKD